MGDSASALTIPYAALLDDAGQAYVFVVGRRRRASARRRDRSRRAATASRSTKGLKPGERVVIEGGTAVEDGMKVRTQ